MGFRMQGAGPAPAGEAMGWDWSATAAPDTARPIASRPVSTRRWAVRGCVAGFLATLLVAAAGFALFVSCLERRERLPPVPADGIVALTGGAQRIGDAIDLLAGGYGRRLLITGVNERTSREEISRLNPGQQHWIACCVDLDYRARNTIGNAIETRRWMRENHFRSVAVVTSNYHMPRTLVELGHALVPGERVLPHPVVTDTVDPGRWWRPSAARILASEYVKFVVAWLRTKVERDPEHSHAAALVGRGKPVKVVAEPLIR
jgi:uncharacterized SAM-binding protein YcdF (DUF218 family)